MQNYDYADFAILYRTNAQSRILEEALRKREFLIRYTEACLSISVRK